MAFTLNMTSGMLHDSEADHASGEEFERADAADIAANRAGMSMRMCKQCFPGSRNNADFEPEMAPAVSDAPAARVDALDDEDDD